jgi:hypothetical protein
MTEKRRWRRKPARARHEGDVPVEAAGVTAAVAGLPRAAAARVGDVVVFLDWAQRAQR